MSYGPPNDGATDWQGLSVIALAVAAISIPIVVGQILGDHMSDRGVGVTFWVFVGLSVACAVVACVRSMRILRTRHTRRGMAWIGLGLSIPMLLLEIVMGIGTLVLWFFLRDLTF